jgi:hypothetical protein
MENVTGQVARGANFFNRTEEIAKFWTRLQTDNLLLLAPRRVGKTSVLRQMNESASLAGFSGIFLDVSDCRDELHFVQRLYSAILDHHSGANRNFIGRTITLPFSDSSYVASAAISLSAVDTGPPTSLWTAMILIENTTAS